MEQHLAPQELLRFLQAEAETLQQMQSRISNELHHLQVEEEVYVRTLDRLNQNAANNPSNSTNGNAGEDTRGATAAGRQAGLELLEALHQELASAVPPVSMLPLDSAVPTTLAITATETVDGNDAKLQSAGPSDFEFRDDEQEEYELLDALESGEVKL
ncbi:hypothetical protein M758_11G005300 [Ceratodon purpureus]|uniref:Uncharacterized protein n=1 Tax=Ceratodon purpureus TaxID=3225 RepID=A0A8T0GDC8_CERPU|nr:hypothetical protein KC19_11G006300 [Ceratodon purpureus]KAG0600074.1 hypothetical protein M758_11G005300 [Ceratodon purpureus]